MSARWWTFRRAQSLKAATYTCPFCGEFFPALTEHMLLFPEGDKERRRHAHTDCALAERRAGRLPTRGDWRAAQRGVERRGLIARLFGGR